MTTAVFVDPAAVLAEHSLVELTIAPSITGDDYAGIICQCGTVAIANVGQRPPAHVAAELFEGHLFDTVAEWSQP